MILLSLVFFEKVAKRAREYGDDSKNEAAQEALKESHISNVDKKEADLILKETRVYKRAQVDPLMPAFNGKTRRQFLSARGSSSGMRCPEFLNFQPTPATRTIFLDSLDELAVSTLSNAQVALVLQYGGEDVRSNQAVWQRGLEMVTPAPLPLNPGVKRHPFSSLTIFLSLACAGP